MTDIAEPIEDASVELAIEPTDSKQLDLDCAEVADGQDHSQILDAWNNEQTFLDFGEPSPLRPTLSFLLQTGANNFDPVRFSHIVSLARRALEQKVGIMQIVEKKALKALEDYQSDFVQAQKQAAITVQHHNDVFPETGEKIQRHFDECDFKAVKRIHKLEQQKQSINSLTALGQKLKHNDLVLEHTSHGESLEEVLRDQEQAILQSLVDSDNNSAQQYGHWKTQHSRELKSLEIYRRSSTNRNAHKTVTRAIKESPKKPGPLNPHMLATHTLSTMRDLSPRYVSKLVPYLDTLLWLEKAVEKPKVKKKKKARKKTTTKKSDSESPAL